MDNFYGIKDLKVIEHGQDKDPEIEYRGARFNFYDIESMVFGCYEERMHDNGVKHYQSPDMFREWISNNTDVVYDCADMYCEFFIKDFPYYVLKDPSSELAGHCYSYLALNQILNDASRFGSVKKDDFRPASSKEKEILPQINDIQTDLEVSMSI